MPSSSLRIEAGFAGSVPKASGGGGVCEDACGIVADGTLVRAVVADGASDSLHADRWAQRLVDAALTSFPARDAWFQTEDLARVRRSWQEAEDHSPSLLPWYAVETKQQRGAFAALLALEMDTEAETVRAVAVGDSVAVLIRNGRVAAGIPFRQEAEFPALPFLVGSKNDPIPSEAIRRYAGALTPGDDWYLLSDALAIWFLREAEKGNEPWRWFRGLGNKSTSRQDFAGRIAQLRSDGRLRDDDTTLVSLRVLPQQDNERESDAPE